jgi:hypothetical protein
MIPIDKSWAIRCIALDILHGYRDSVEILKYHKLPTDVQYAVEAVEKWDTHINIPVGESGTLYRFLQYIIWHTGDQKHLTKSGTLLNRKICADKYILNYSFEELLKLDKGTSQWASAAYLCGKRGIPKKIPVKLQTTIDAYNHWTSVRGKDEKWEVRFDDTILQQVVCFTDMYHKRETNWKPKHSEDYCFARAMGLITKEEGLSKWPTLVNHETNRIDEMERAITLMEYNGVISSPDHRVVQSLAMKSVLDNRYFICWTPKVVEKSWPQFWEFINSKSY